MYGYMRVGEDIPVSDEQQMELVLKDYAEREGFCYVTTFCEYVPGSMGAFIELTEELQRAEARNVIMPPLSHVSTHPMLLDHLVERLTVAADAYVVALDELTSTPTAAERSLPDDNDPGRSGPPNDQ
jgi:hypothetical protein